MFYLFTLFLRKKGQGGVFQGSARVSITEIYKIVGNKNILSFIKCLATKNVIIIVKP